MQSRASYRCVFLTALIALPLSFLAACVGPPLFLFPEELPNAVQGQNYSVTLDTDVAQDNWRLAGGALPPGIALQQSTGVLAGRPTVPGFYDFTLAASSAGLPARSGQRTYTLYVIPRLELVLLLPVARVGEPYNALPTIVGGVPGYNVSVVGLPAGLDYDRSTGRIFGTPLNADAGRRIEMLVNDAGIPTQSATASAILLVKPPGVAITLDTLPDAPIGQAYSTFVTATDGRPPYVWQVSNGLLPDGLRLEVATGEIRGTPTSLAASATIEITVTDSDTPLSQARQLYRLIVPVRIATASLPTTSEGEAYAATLAAEGGTAPYTWALAEGSALPAGLTLDAAAGTITGTPEPGAATQTFSLVVTDADSPALTATAEFTLTVEP